MAVLRSNIISLIPAKQDEMSSFHLFQALGLAGQGLASEWEDCRDRDGLENEIEIWLREDRILKETLEFYRYKQFGTEDQKKTYELWKNDPNNTSKNNKIEEWVKDIKRYELKKQLSSNNTITSAKYG